MPQQSTASASFAAMPTASPQNSSYTLEATSAYAALVEAFFDEEDALAALTRRLDQAGGDWRAATLASLANLVSAGEGSANFNTTPSTAFGVRFSPPLHESEMSTYFASQQAVHALAGTAPSGSYRGLIEEVDDPLNAPFIDDVD